MTTYAEAIADRRALREEISASIERLRLQRNEVSAEILELERAIARPKMGRASPNDIVMTVEPAVVAAKPSTGG